ncbi:four-carbon acid sugar kinase family protein [Paenibacillus cisolokensis]|uniref:four-carbon acid sugar kinase family protein n=1 Tax=Paenibacillus cisolokensis TaxID=1658519 RepID=UPI003D265857
MDSENDRREGRLLCYYGDDFTGSTDALEALAASGVETALFLSPPSPELLAWRFPNVRCIGVAGVSRSLAPEEMERELAPQLAMLQSYGTPVVHYKICSTFDSSPETGSIGRMLELGRRLFAGQRFVPLLAGAPALRRYTVFGHHFAAAGDETYRLDRHPTMSRHPVTPMDESDLRLHLARQTKLPVGLMELTALDGPYEDVRSRLEERLARTPAPDAVLFDVLDEARLETAGRLIWEEALGVRAGDAAGAGQTRAGEAGGTALFAGAGTSGPDGRSGVVWTGPSGCNGQAGRFGAPGGQGLFAIGSSGIEYALAAHWRKAGIVPPEPVRWEDPGETDKLLVVSGSCSPVTEAQLQRAVADGYAGIRVPVWEWLDPAEAERSMLELLEKAVRRLREGRSVILYTAQGSGDPAIGRLREAMHRRGVATAESGRLIGTRLGRLARDILLATDVTRLLIAGGDTSGYATRELGAHALTCLRRIVPGGPLCRCHARDSRLDGLELALKGGQVGGPDYFELVRRGGS